MENKIAQLILHLLDSNIAISICQIYLLASVHMKKM